MKTYVFGYVYGGFFRFPELGSTILGAPNFGDTKTRYVVDEVRHYFESSEAAMREMRSWNASQPLSDAPFYVYWLKGVEEGGLA